MNEGSDGDDSGDTIKPTSDGVAIDGGGRSSTDINDTNEGDVGDGSGTNDGNATDEGADTASSPRAKAP